MIKLGRSYPFEGSYIKDISKPCEDFVASLEKTHDHDFKALSLI